MTTKLKRGLAAATATLAFLGAVVIPETAAHATKGNCFGWYGTWNFTVECASTVPDDYRARVNCFPYHGGAMVVRYGPWRVASVTSVATCPSGYEPSGGVVQWDDGSITNPVLLYN